MKYSATKYKIKLGKVTGTKSPEEDREKTLITKLLVWMGIMKNRD